jgi:SHAQKYF class myb-like DNA-binding protein
LLIISRRLFLLGLTKFGKGDWRSISRNFVTSRTPTQVASHAQKYFIRLNSINKDKRRSSIHDITNVNNYGQQMLQPSHGTIITGRGGLAPASGQQPLPNPVQQGSIQHGMEYGRQIGHQPALGTAGMLSALDPVPFGPNKGHMQQPTAMQGTTLLSMQQHIDMACTMQQPAMHH